MHDSFTPLGGMVVLANIMLGEIVFGGVGSGLYGMLIYVVLSVFIAGLMVGRTPEYLGKKIEAFDVKMAMLYVLIFPLLILVLTAVSILCPAGSQRHYQPRPARLEPDSVCVHVSCREQRIGVCGDQRQYQLVQHQSRLHDAGGTISDDGSHAGAGGTSGTEEERAAIAGNLSGEFIAVHRSAHGRDFDCWRADVFPGVEPWTNS